MLKTLNIDTNIDYLNAPHDSFYEINFKNWWKKQQIINAYDIKFLITLFVSGLITDRLTLRLTVILPIRIYHRNARL